MPGYKQWPLYKTKLCVTSKAGVHVHCFQGLHTCYARLPSSLHVDNSCFTLAFALAALAAVCLSRSDSKCLHKSLCSDPLLSAAPALLPWMTPATLQPGHLLQTEKLARQRRSSHELAAAVASTQCSCKCAKLDRTAHKPAASRFASQFPDSSPAGAGSKRLFSICIKHHQQLLLTNMHRACLTCMMPSVLVAVCRPAIDFYRAGLTSDAPCLPAAVLCCIRVLMKYKGPSPVSRSSVPALSAMQ